MTVSESITSFNMPTKVKDLKEDLCIHEDEWNKCVIYKRSYSTAGEFEAEYILKDNKVLFRPIKPYYSHEFEVLFGFGMGCDNFSKNKIIEVTEPQNYFDNYNQNK